jgi:hypothetical protein
MDDLNGVQIKETKDVDENSSGGGCGREEGSFSTK